MLGPIQYDWCPYIKVKFDTNLPKRKTTGRQTGRRQPCDWHDAITSQGMPAVKEDFPLGHERPQHGPNDTLILTF